MNSLIAIVGPTGSGKSAVALELARRRDGEIVSVDSMQVYRGMDIGTAKPTVLERAEIAHHLIDVVDPIDEFGVAEFRTQGQSAVHNAVSPMIICGGSGLHFRSLVDPMSFAPTDPQLRQLMEERPLAELVAELTDVDPEADTVIDLANKRRVVRSLEVVRLDGGTPSQRFNSDEAERLRKYESEISFLGFGIDPGDAFESRVAARLERMAASGLVEEVSGLEPVMGRNARAAIGYREVLDALAGRVTFEEAFRSIGSNTMKLARRQRTWFKRDPRITWIPWSDDPVTLADQIEELWIE